MQNLNWNLKLIQGVVLLKENDVIVGEVDTFGFLKKQSKIVFKGETIHFKSEILSKNKVIMYDSSLINFRTTLNLKLWSSSANFNYNNQHFTYSSSFFGTGNIEWKKRDTTISTINFKGKIQVFDDSQKLAAILIGCGIQLSMLYFSFILLAGILISYVII